MSNIDLLDKTRKINKLLHNNTETKVMFNDICQVLSEILDSDVIVLSKKGKILGIGLKKDIKKINELVSGNVGEFVDNMFNERVLSILSTKENVNLETLGFTLEKINMYNAIISPIDIAGERLGTLFIYRNEKQYNIEDIILSEYGTTVVGLEMIRSVDEENAEDQRKREIVKSAYGTLSSSEKEAIGFVLNELDGTEGTLIASKIADRVGITRSVIVNALKKFESAGVIKTRSSGMKGTHIKVINELVLENSEIHNKI